MSDDYDFNRDVPDDHDLIRERRNPADRKGGRAYTWWREMLRAPPPEILSGILPNQSGAQVSAYPLTHPWWPEKGHKLNTDRHYDDHVEMFGEIPGYVPSCERGYVPRSHAGNRAVKSVKED